MFARAKEVVRFEEQEEDIGCASSGSSAVESSMSSSDEVELADDASSSGSTGHFEMASLMTQLPIKCVRLAWPRALPPAGLLFRLTKDLILAGICDLTRCFVWWWCRRGLSKFFDGKSQSFASLAEVGGLEDLPKPPAKRLKTSRSCGIGLKDAHRGRVPTAVKKQAIRARLAPRSLVRARHLVSASPARLAAVAGQPLLFA